MKQKVVVKARFIPRCQTLEEWKTENPVLLAGEHGVAIDGKGDEREKIGDGATAWNELEWWKGLSAYEIALKNGFVGTEEEWLESLKIDGIDSSDTDITVKKHLIADAGLHVNSPDNYNCDLTLDNEGFVFNGNDNYLTIPSSGPITIYGVGGIDLGGCRIKNLDPPIDDNDAANKEYVDKKVNKITRGNVTAIDDYDSTEDSVPYLYGVYGDKTYDYAETQGLIKGSTGKLNEVMIQEETDPDKKALLERGILPDHSYADIHTVAIRDGNASIPVGIIGTQYGDLDEETGTFPVEKESVLWYGAAVPHTLLNEVHKRELQYAQYQRKIAVKEAVKEANIDNLHNGSGEGSLQQNTCTAIGDYNIATGNETQAGVKGFKVTSVSIVNAEDSVIDIPYALLTIETQNDIDFNGLSGYNAQLDLSKHWYNRYIVMDATGFPGADKGTVLIIARYPEQYPINETNLALGDGDTDNWIWFTDINGNIIQLEDAVPIDQYIGGFATGYQSLAAGYGAFAAGRETKAIGNYSTALGRQTTADYASMAIGLKTHALGQQSFAQGTNTKAIGSCAVAEGNGSQAIGNYSHAGGANSIAKGTMAFAHGSAPEAQGDSSFATGNKTYAIGKNAFAVGYSTRAEGENSFAAGQGTKALNIGATAIGTGNTASGVCSYAAGSGCQATAYYSFAQGWNNTAKNTAATALGQGTIASVVGQTVVGTFNKEDYNALFIVGNGTDDDNRSNAFAVYKDGSIKLGNTTVTEQQLQKLLALIE